MKGTAVVVLAMAVTSLSGCGGVVAGAHPAASDPVAVSGSGASYTPVYQPRRGFEDFPTWMPRKHYRPKKPYFDDFVPQPIALPDCPGEVSPHFNTPEAAMTYLASAWNRDDLGELCQVTNPNARLLLLDMHREAVNLRLQRCDWDGVGHYSCIFDHDYPKKMHKKGIGHTLVDVESADTPGWYMTIYEGCG